MSEPLEPAEHLIPAPEHGWAAKDVDPTEYTDDDYADQFPEVSDGSESR